MPNRLIHESSPYLQQHAHNPVDWYPWGEEALEKAKTENKPILLSIGYATCHWCHVMERESFEHERVAAFMNENFINIKVDREERPDIDNIYMEVIQLISGQGGWPLNCFLLPDGRAFFAGTYFPPRESYGRIAWSQVLVNISNAFKNTPEVVEQQANTILQYLGRSTENFVKPLQDLATTNSLFNKELPNAILNNLAEDFDKEDGGFGSAPKFPSSIALTYLLEYAKRKEEFAKEAWQHVAFSLEKMALGGIYDQIGGGFSRYAVDKDWFAPHFEKMLYDNALLMKLYAEAYQYKANPLYKNIIEETYQWLQREMLSPKGAYYAALDADSEGEEGKYYVWTWQELKATLSEENLDFCAKYYHCTEQGNWEEGKNILFLKEIPYSLYQKFGMTESAFLEKTRLIKEQLLNARHKRIKPGLDNKILLDWNALLVQAFVQAYMALGNEKYKNAAIHLIQSLENLFAQDTGKLWHSFSEEKGSKIQAFIDDYAFYIQALLSVYQVTFDISYLEKAAKYTDFVLAEFLDEKDHLFFFSAAYASGELIVRNKDLYDNATPSGNAMMFKNLQLLDLIYPEKNYAIYFEKGMAAMIESISKYPLSFSLWAQNAIHMIQPWREIVFLGKGVLPLANKIQQMNLPQTLILASEEENNDLALMQNRPAKDGNATIYICENNTCAAPVYNLEQALQLLK